MLHRLLGCRRLSITSLSRRLVTSASKRRGDSKDWMRLYSLAHPERKIVAGAVGFLFLSSGVTMMVPFALGKIVDTIYKLNDSETGIFSGQNGLNALCLILCGVFGVGALSNFGRVYLINLAGQRITARMRSRVFRSLVHQETGFFDVNKTGELINRLSSDSTLISQAVTTQISNGLRSTIMAASGVGMMFYMSPQLACVGLALVPPTAGWAVWMGKHVKMVGREYQDALADATQVAQEKISNFRTVRSFGKEFVEASTYNKKIDNVLSKGVKEALIQAKFYGLTGLLGNSIILSVLFYGGIMVSEKTITVGSLTSFILYSAYVGIGLNGMSNFYAEMMKAMGAGARIWEIIDRKPKMSIDEGLIPNTSLVGNIHFENVDFSYPTRSDKTVLSGMDLNVEANRILALVGTSGSGKSTIAALMLRLYDPDRGRISIDGFDVREINSTWLRKQIGIVMQEPILFSGSIRENILYGVDEEVSEENILAASKESNAHEFIMNFPDGYKTLVGERGVLLSGGQKQRIAIARALLKNPQILLLDEATSALDASSEHEVKEALSRVMKGRTVVTIAHRLSTIRNADRIAVLDKGQIVETGTYLELSTLKNGHFNNLIEKQTFKTA